MTKPALLPLLLAIVSLSEANLDRWFDWMITAGGYKFENEASEKHYGFEASFLPEPYYGFVVSVDKEGNSFTRNLGVELIGNALLIRALNDLGASHKFYMGPYWPLILFPGIELGASFSPLDEVGLHTSLFINFVIIHPYLDYNFYQSRSEKKVGVKFKLGFGPWFIDMMQQ